MRAAWISPVLKRLNVLKRFRHFESSALDSMNPRSLNTRPDSTSFDGVP
jgi:hypothetical protein